MRECSEENIKLCTEEALLSGKISFEDNLYIKLDAEQGWKSYLLSRVAFLHMLSLIQCPIYPLIYYNGDVFLLKENRVMDKSLYYFKIPYCRHNEFVSIVYEVNRRISKNGFCELNVNNIPTHLDSILAFDDKEEGVRNVKEYLAQNGIEVKNDKTFKDLFDEKKGDYGIA